MRAQAAGAPPTHDRPHWGALVVLCLGVLMIAVSSTIVNVVLASIGADLDLSETAVVWVADTYLATFAGFLLLAGRLGDLFGHRRLFLVGIALFSVASLECGLAVSTRSFIAGRAIQGLGAATVSSVALSLIVNLFAEGPQRAKALGIYAFVSAGGGSLGMLFGGILTSVWSWHWVFLINVPLGAIIWGLSIVLLPPGRRRLTRERMDVAGAITITSSMILMVYGILNSYRAGWASFQTAVVLASAVALLILFVGIEARVKAPLMPLSLLRIRNLAISNIAGSLLAVAVSWSFIFALWLQRVLHYSPLQVGLALVPASLATTVTSLVFAPRLVIRFGITRPLVIGMLITSSGLALLALVPIHPNASIGTLLAVFLVGLGLGVAYNPLLISALRDVSVTDSGAASGLFSTVYTMSGALGLSVLASVAAGHTGELLGAGADLSSALRDGYHLALCIATLFPCLAALICVALLRAEVSSDVRGTEYVDGEDAFPDSGIRGP